MNLTSRNRGVTLLELSIVLVIIGLIAASIIVGRTLLSASKVQTAMTDADNYMKAMGQFKDTYLALPGDFANATSLWGTDSSGCPSGGGATGTCNGNGDGKVGMVCSGGSIDSSYSYEIYRVWQQLNSANMVLTSLTPTGSMGLFTPGVNVPRSSIEGAGFSLMWIDDPLLCSNYYGLIPNTGNYGNTLLISSGSTTSALTSQEADSIDRKMDDGIPSTGNVRAPGTISAPNCTATTTTYNLTNTNRVCSVVFLTNL